MGSRLWIAGAVHFISCGRGVYEGQEYGSGRLGPAWLLSVGDAEWFAAASRKVTSPSRWTDRGIVSLAAFATALEKVTATLKKISRYGASALV